MGIAVVIGLAGIGVEAQRAKEPTIYPVTITFDDRPGDKITSDGNAYPAQIFTGNGTASFDITRSSRSLKLLFDERIAVGAYGLTTGVPSGLLSASGSVGFIDLGQVGYAPAARYVRITLVGTTFKDDTLGFRRLTAGSTNVVVDGTPVCAVKTMPGVWRVSTLPSEDPLFAGCASIGDPAESAGEIGAVFRSSKNSIVKVANYRMPFAMTVSLDCSVLSSTAPVNWCD